MKSKKDLLKNPWFYVSLIFAIILIVLFKIIILTPNIINEGNEEVNNLPGQGVVQVSMDDDAFKGNENAPITMIEFSDYECPFCGRYFQQTLPQIISEYVDTGKVKIVYRDFPLGFHQNAQKAAEATEVARELGGNDKFWEMHDKIFENQQAMTVSDLKKYAREIGLNGGEFDSLLDSGKYASEVQKDLQDGQNAGVQGTPTFFINGQKLVGAQPFEAFQQIIEQELNK